MLRDVFVNGFYLFVLGQILNLPLVYTLGSAVTGVSLVGIWCMYFLFYQLKHRLWGAFGGLFLLAIARSMLFRWSYCQ